jgi:hypothetical protein
VQLWTLEAPVFSGGNTPQNPPTPVPNWKLSAAGRAALAVQQLFSLDLGPIKGVLPVFGVNFRPEHDGSSWLVQKGATIQPAAVLILVGTRPIDEALAP